MRTTDFVPNACTITQDWYLATAGTASTPAPNIQDSSSWQIFYADQDLARKRAKELSWHRMLAPWIESKKPVPQQQLRDCIGATGRCFARRGSLTVLKCNVDDATLTAIETMNIASARRGLSKLAAGAVGSAAKRNGKFDRKAAKQWQEFNGLWDQERGMLILINADIISTLGDATSFEPLPEVTKVSAPV